MELPYVWVRRASPVGQSPRVVFRTDHVKLTRALLSLVTRQRKAVSGLIFKIETGSRELTSAHQRCDGKRPCTTCVDGERGAECTYEPRQRSHRASASALPVSRQTTSHPRNARTLPSEPPASGFSFSGPLTRPSLSVPLLTLSKSSSKSPSSLLPSTPPLSPYEPPLAPSSRVCSEILPGPSPDLSVVGRTHDTTEFILSSFTILPSIHLQTIPRPLPVPLSLIPPERVQVSPNSGSDLDMTLYVLFRALNSHLTVGTKL